MSRGAVQQSIKKSTALVRYNFFFSCNVLYFAVECMLTYDANLMYELVKQSVIVNGSLEYLFCLGRSICGKKMLF